MGDHPLRPGTRVRHYGQQYPEARRGTATVLEAKPWHDGTFEYRVEVDDDPMPRWWSSRATIEVSTPAQ